MRMMTRMMEEAVTTAEAAAPETVEPMQETVVVRMWMSSGREIFCRLA